MKLDQKLLSDIDCDEKARVIVQAVVQLIKGVGCEVVAEAVETIAQADILRAMGCDTVQGYIFAPAMLEDIFSNGLRALAISQSRGRSLRIRSRIRCSCIKGAREGS